MLKSTAIGTPPLVTKAGITIDVHNSSYIINFEANVILQPKNKPFNIYADYPDLLFVDKLTGKSFPTFLAKTNLVNFEKLYIIHDLFGHPCAPITKPLADRFRLDFVRFNCNNCLSANLVRSIPKFRKTRAKRPFNRSTWISPLLKCHPTMGSIVF